MVIPAWPLTSTPLSVIVMASNYSLLGIQGVSDVSVPQYGNIETAEIVSITPLNHPILGGLFKAAPI
jgi:hypothetical protein